MHHLSANLYISAHAHLSLSPCMFLWCVTLYVVWLMAGLLQLCPSPHFAKLPGPEFVRAAAARLCSFLSGHQH